MPAALATKGVFPNFSFNKSQQTDISSLEVFFEGGSGTITYSASSGTTSCVTVGAVTLNSGSQLLPITTTGGTNACNSRITLTARDAIGATAEQTFAIYTPKLKFASGASIANQDLTRGADAITIPNVAQHFEGGIRPDITYSTSVVTNSITPNSETVCVTVTQPDGSNDFTVTPTAVCNSNKLYCHCFRESI